MKNRLEEWRVKQLLEMYKYCPGICCGIVAEHEARGASRSSVDWLWDIIMGHKP
jgi:hypothetical protein